MKKVDYFFQTWWKGEFFHWIEVEGGESIKKWMATGICYMMLIVKDKLGYDDSLDAFGIHGVGGIVGAVMLIFFIRDSWIDEAANLAGGSWTI